MDNQELKDFDEFLKSFEQSNDADVQLLVRKSQCEYLLEKLTRCGHHVEMKYSYRDETRNRFCLQRITFLGHMTLARTKETIDILTNLHVNDLVCFNQFWFPDEPMLTLAKEVDSMVYASLVTVTHSLLNPQTLMENKRLKRIMQATESIAPEELVKKMDNANKKATSILGGSATPLQEEGDDNWGSVSPRGNKRQKKEEDLVPILLTNSPEEEYI